MKKIREFWNKLNKRGKILVVSLLVLVVIGLITGLVLLLSPKKEPKKKNEVNETYTPEEVKDIKIVDLNSTSRPYAVMINNVNVARPYQSGLQDAYIIYEMIVEGGITRYLALFRDVDVERIGTVRSARHYYLDYALENDAYYVHWGWSPQAQSDISTLKINNIPGGTRFFWKDTSLNVATEHTAYTSTERLNEAVDYYGYRKELQGGLLLTYSPDSLDLASDETAIDATSIDINYSSYYRNHYDYDAENKVYKRSVNGTPHTDFVTKEQYTFKNIIVYQVANSTIAGDNKGRQEFDNLGSGEGYYISEGKAIEITWEKTSRSSKTKYKVKSTGKDLVVNDGNTFIQIQPKNQTLNIN